MSRDRAMDNLRIDGLDGSNLAAEPDYDHLAPDSVAAAASSSAQPSRLPIATAAAAATATAASENDAWYRNEGKGKTDSHSASQPEIDTQSARETHDYVLGTLIVRVVAARGLENPRRNDSGRNLFGHRFGGGPTRAPISPYASVKFGNSVQRTSEVFNSNDPVWPRHETLYLDVSLPIDRLAHNPPSDAVPESTLPGSTENSLSRSAKSATSLESETGVELDAYGSSENTVMYDPPNSILTVAIFTGDGQAKQKNDKQKTKGFSGDSDDTFLGMASVDVIQLLTGMSSVIDEWIPIAGVASQSGRVRITCEYETNEQIPKRGDICRFTQFCNPEDLFPLVPYQRYSVAEVNGDNVQLSYKTPEGWVCAFQVNRLMIVCDTQSTSPLQVYQEELASITERLSHSIAASKVNEAIDRVPVDGLLAIGHDVVHGSLAVFGRWFSNGIDTAVTDIVRATNWDGQFNPPSSVSLDIPGDENDTGTGSNGRATLEDDGQSQTLQEVQQHVSSLLDLDTTLGLDQDSDKPAQALPNMPPCPITGEPMLEPVVAADGHTYERSAIRRWLSTSNKSPLTGAVLAHKNLVPNYGLISSVEALTKSKSDDA